MANSISRNGRCDTLSGSTSRGRRLAAVAALASAALLATATAQPVMQTTTTGMVSGDFTVTSRGTATYKIDVPVPPGTNDVQPQLALAYDNANRAGMLGVGWTLSGLPQIGRIGANIAQDGFRGGVSYSADDRFAYSGQRLIAIQGPDGGEGSRYRTEIESWQNIVSYTRTDAGGSCGSGPCWWAMTTSKGVRYEFGRTDDSRIASGSPDGSVRVWAVNKVEDLNGNNLAVTYTATPVAGIGASGQYYPLRIDYTANGKAGLAAQRRIDFTYEAMAQPIRTFIGGFLVETRAQLKRVITSVDGTPAPGLTLTYDTSPSTGRSRITAITQCSGDGALCLPPTRFNWSTSGLTFLDSGAWLNNDFVQNWTDEDPRFVGDVNGDGLADIVGFRLDTQVSLAQHSNSFTAATSWNPGFGNTTGWRDSRTPRMIGDVNGDGIDDVVGFNTTGVEVALSTGGAFSKSGWSQAPYPYFGLDVGAGGWARDRDPRMMADVNGDGRADIVGFRDKTYVALSLGDRFETPVVWNDGDFTGAAWWETKQRIRLIGDVNGDGRADIVAFSSDRIIVGLSTGGQTNRFDLTLWPQNQSQTPYNEFTFVKGWRAETTPRLLMDVNGDGMADIVGFKDGVWVALSTGKGFLPPQRWNPGFGSESSPPWRAGEPRFLVDINGDALPDVVGLSTNNGARTALASGNAFIDAPWNQNSLPSYVGGTGKPVMGSDVNGDGLADVVVFGAKRGAPVSVSVGLAASPQADLMTKVTNGLGGTLDITYAPMSDPAVYRPGTTAADPVRAVAGLTSFNAPLPFAYSDVAANYPTRNVVGGPVYLVKRVVESTDPAVQVSRYSYATQYSYTDAKLDQLAQRWLGFASKTLYFEGDGKKTTEFYNQVYPLNSTLQRREIRCGQPSTDPRCTPDSLMTVGTMVQQAVQTAQGSGPLRTPVYDVRNTSQQIDQYTYGTYNTSTKNSYVYDQYGNPTLASYFGHVDRDGRDLNSDDNVYICKDYVDDAPNWRLGYLRTVKRSSISDCGTLQTFRPGIDLTLSVRTYDSAGGTMNVLTDARWDSQANKYLTYLYGYDAVGNRTTSQDPEGFIWTRVYDPVYRSFVVEDRGPPLRDPDRVLTVRFNFDPRFGEQIAQVDQNGNAKLTCLDSLGREIGAQAQRPDASVPNDPPCVTSGLGSNALVVTTSTTTWQADSAKGLYSETLELQDWPTAGAKTLLFTRNYLDGRARSYKNVKQGNPATGNIAGCVVFDGYNRRKMVSLPYLTGSDPDCGENGSTPFWIKRSYDVVGRIVERQRPSGNDGRTTVIDRTDYRDYLTARQTLAANGPTPYVRTLRHGMFLNERSLVELVVESNNNAKTTIGRDRLGRIVTTTAPATSADPNGITTTYTLDSLGRKILIDSPDRGQIASDFGGGEWLRRKTTANGTETYDYDSQGRLLRQRFAGGTVLEFEYDSTSVTNGRGFRTLARASTPSQPPIVQTIGYDTNSNPSDVSLTGLPPDANRAFRTVTAYDPQKRARRLDLPDGSRLERAYQFDNVGELSLGGRQIARIPSYSAQAKPTRIEFSGGAIVETIGYAPIGTMVSDRVASGGRVLADRAITWSTLEEVERIEDRARLDGTDVTERYEYRSLRLTSAKGPFGDLAFDYDGAGNLVRHANQGLGRTTDYTYRNFQVREGKVAGNVVFSAQYDGYGSMTSRVTDSRSLALSYVADAALQTVTQASRGELVAYRYDADGQRAVKIDRQNNLTTLYVGPSFQVTIDGQGRSLTTAVVHDDSGALATVTTGDPAVTGPGVPKPGTLHLHRNQVGSTVLTTKPDGNWSSLISYAPYGLPLIIRGPDDFRQKFTGNELDEEVGFYFFASRYLDPDTGRFVTADKGPSAGPEIQDSLNSYAYVAGRPTSLIDPSGQFIPLIAAAIAEVGAVAAEVAAEGVAVAAEAGAAVGETASATTSGVAASSAVAASETATATTATIDAGVEAAASTAARTAIVSEQTLSATTSFSGEELAGASTRGASTALDRTAFQAERALMQCPSPCRGSGFLQKTWDAVKYYTPWGDRPFTLYRGMSNPVDIVELEQSQLLRSPQYRVNGFADVPEGWLPRFATRFAHSLDSTGSPWVSTTRSPTVARWFAGSRGQVYAFQVPRNQVYRAWHSPLPWEFEVLAEDGQSVMNVNKM